MRARVCLSVAVAALTGCSSEPASVPEPQPTRDREARSATFTNLPPGWHQFDEGLQRRGRCHTIAYTLAASWRADRAGSHGWAAEMPPDAIAIGVGLYGPVRAEDRRNPHYPPIGDLPLELPSTTASYLEGSPDVPEYRVSGRLSDYLVDVRADINNPAPGRALLRQARSVVRRVRLPDWPKLC
jgi:hypothetical protein